MQHRIVSVTSPSEIAPYLKALFQKGYAALYDTALDMVQDKVDVLTFKLLPGLPDLHVVLNPTLVSRALSEPKIFEKSRILSLLYQFGGTEGVFCSTGTQWMQRRQITIDLFGKKQFESFQPIIARHVDALIKQWEKNGKSDNLHHDLHGFVTRLLAEITFGKAIDPASKEIDDLHTSLGLIGKRLFEVIGSPVRLITNGRITGIPEELKTALDVIDAFMDRLIREHNDLPIVTKLAKLHGYNGGAMSELQRIGIKEDIFQILIESSETTSAALSWTLHELAQAPKWQSAIETEASTSTDKRNLHAVIAEGIRKHSVFAIALPRTCQANHTLALEDSTPCLTVHQGDVVAFPLWAINMSPRIFDKPENFYPPRQFAKKTSARTMLTAFAPGAHSCTGKDLYVLIADTLLSSLMQKMSISTDEDHHPGLNYSPSIAPRFKKPHTFSCPFSSR